MTAPKKVLKKDLKKEEPVNAEPVKTEASVQAVIRFVNGLFKTEFFTDKTADEVKDEITSRDIYWKSIIILDIKNDKITEIVNKEKKAKSAVKKEKPANADIIRVKDMTEEQRKGITDAFLKVWEAIGTGLLEANRIAGAPAMSKDEVINIVLDGFNDNSSDDMKAIFSKMTPKGKIIIGQKAFTKKEYA